MAVAAFSESTAIPCVSRIRVMIVFASVSSAALLTMTVSPSTTTGCFLVFFVVAARATSCAVARLPIWRCRTSTG